MAITDPKVKRSQFLTFMNTTPDATETWSLVGKGVTDAAIDYNPQMNEEIYITEDSGSADVESYKPSMGVESTAVIGDEVFEFVDTLRKNRAILGDAYTSIVNVWMYETEVTGSYPAEKQDVTIAINSWGGPGGEANRISYNIAYRGNPTPGTFNPATKTWTAA